MTERIIQKVFKKYKSFKFKEGDAMLEFANQIQLDSLEKELIEEIQKEFSFGCEHCFGVCKQCIEVSVKLTGDSY